MSMHVSKFKDDNGKVKYCINYISEDEYYYIEQAFELLKHDSYSDIPYEISEQLQKIRVSKNEV